MKWGCSLDTIKKRWGLWQEWDLVYRIGKMFSSEDENKPKKAPKIGSEENDEALDMALGFMAKS